MFTGWRILKQVLRAVVSLDRFQTSIRLRGRIRVSLDWDFGGER
jgi:hypothetical protein